MFDIGGQELLLLLLLALLIFGPRRLPQFGRQLGGFVAQMRQAMRDVQGTLEREVALEDVKSAREQVLELKRDAASLARELTGVGKPPYADPSRRTGAPPQPALPAAAPEPEPAADAAPPTPPDAESSSGSNRPDPA